MNISMPWVRMLPRLRFTLREMAETIIEALYLRSTIATYLLWFHQLSSRRIWRNLNGTTIHKRSQLWRKKPKDFERTILGMIAVWQRFPISNCKQKISGNKVTIANLLTLCGAKHIEQDASFHRYKGRIVYRGDDIRDQDGCQVVFDPLETSTN